MKIRSGRQSSLLLLNQENVINEEEQKYNPYPTTKTKFGSQSRYRISQLAQSNTRMIGKSKSTTNFLFENPLKQGGLNQKLELRMTQKDMQDLQDELNKDVLSDLRPQFKNELKGALTITKQSSTKFV